MPSSALFKLVAPHDPVDVLNALKDLKLIEAFRIGGEYVEIESKSQDRFDMAEILSKETEPCEKPSFKRRPPQP